MCVQLACVKPHVGLSGGIRPESIRERKGKLGATNNCLVRILQSTFSSSRNSDSIQLTVLNLSGGLQVLTDYEAIVRRGSCPLQPASLTPQNPKILLSLSLPLSSHSPASLANLKRDALQRLTPHLRKPINIIHVDVHSRQSCKH